MYIHHDQHIIVSLITENDITDVQVYDLENQIIKNFGLKRNLFSLNITTFEIFQLCIWLNKLIIKN